MEVLGTASVRDPQGVLPGGFWEAVGVWLEKPQVANKRLCGARLDGARRVAPSTAPAGGLLEAAWRALRSSVPWEALSGCPEEQGGEVEVVFRTLVPKVSPPSPAKELVVKDIVKGIVTLLPLEQTPEGKCKIKKCNVYQIRLQRIKSNEWSISVLSSSPENYISDGILYPKTSWLRSELLAKLAKWSTEIIKNEFKSTLSCISVAKYSKIYQELKEKYKKIVKVWPEVTNPEKFVYEDVAIAAYLLILWEDERTEKGLFKKQSFVDLGCGNGLLVHILSNEG